MQPTKNFLKIHICLNIWIWLEVRVLHGEQKSGLICQLLDVGKMQKILTLNQFLEYLNWKHKKTKSTMQPTKNFHKIHLYCNKWFRLDVRELHGEKKSGLKCVKRLGVNVDDADAILTYSQRTNVTD